MSRKDNMFKSVPIGSVPRNLFDLSHEVKMSGKFGYLYPCLVMDTLPGDVIREQMTAMVRFAPMLAPVLHRVDVKTHFFFVPYRIICDNWKEFITGGQDGNSAIVLPYITPAGLVAAASIAEVQKGSLWDYMGLPTYGDPPAPVAWSTEQISALPFMAYLQIWNDYYRDPNFDTELDLPVDLSGNISAQLGPELYLRNKSWDKDYFTAQLADPQRGAQVLMPIAGEGTPVYSAVTSAVAVGQVAGDIKTSAAGTTIKNVQTAAGLDLVLQNIDHIDLDNATTTINDLRMALAIQSWLEANARGGARYVEQIEAHFGVRVPDYRLQRAEYLGGGSQPVRISEVLSTADSGGVPVGDMAGHGLSVGKTNRFSYVCQEHGVVIGVVSITPKTAYSQGIEKMWSRTSKFHFGWHQLANLGEQETPSKEIFFSFDNADDAENQELFGYIPRYAEYKFKNDRIAGDFRDNLAFWHLGRIFASRPTLDEVFTTMYENNPLAEETYRRIFAVQDGTDYLWMQLFHHLTARRPLPYYGVPKLKG